MLSLYFHKIASFLNVSSLSCPLLTCPVSTCKYLGQHSRYKDELIGTYINWYINKLVVHTYIHTLKLITNQCHVAMVVVTVTISEVVIQNNNVLPYDFQNLIDHFLNLINQLFSFTMHIFLMIFFIIMSSNTYDLALKIWKLLFSN